MRYTAPQEDLDDRLGFGVGPGLRPGAVGARPPTLGGDQGRGLHRPTSLALGVGDAGPDLVHRGQPILAQAQHHLDRHVAGVVQRPQLGDEGGAELGAEPDKEFLELVEDEDDGPQARARAKIKWTSGSLEDVSLAPLDSDFVSDSLFSDSRLAADSSSEPASQLKAFVTRQGTSQGLGKANVSDPAKTDTPERFAVTTINESAGGYCVRWTGDNIPRVKIGELIGVESILLGLAYKFL